MGVSSGVIRIQMISMPELCTPPSKTVAAKFVAINPIKLKYTKKASEDLFLMNSNVLVKSQTAKTKNVQPAKGSPYRYTGMPRTNAKNIPIVEAIMALAKALDLKVIAEGVENEAQRKFLRGCGCEYLQGFAAGKPADADTAAEKYL